MSDLDPQTRDLRAALRATDPGAPRKAKASSRLVWIILAVLVVLAAAVWYGPGRSLVSPYLGRIAPASAPPSASPAAG